MKKLDISFVVAGSMMTILFLIIVNLLTGTSHMWSVYPVIALFLFPIGVYSIIKKRYTLFTSWASLLLMGFLIFENYRDTPDYPWFLYVFFPLVILPVVSGLRKRWPQFRLAFIITMLTIIYYVSLNLFLSPQYPWAMFPVFAVIWWPLTVYHIQKETYFKYSIHAALLLGIFFTSVNAVFSPATIWAVYPIFGVLWWPLSMYFFVHKRKSHT
ncbi:hypothetical protein [Halobacillus litoralis]|uniref:Uncharacterized protein n=1 Tax=Halobacillus litoralis TaxID=45668 RepID=A0A410M9G0_9BACI|nr:hypothetical protein [Halobacillus litoralis]QAS51374.1 hypothetical protein HLI_03655 [Halobacillus litoralis]